MLERLPMNMIFKKFPAAALIDGEWIISAKTFSVTDPATGADVATVPDLGAKEAGLAIDAAARALPLRALLAPSCRSHTRRRRLPASRIISTRGLRLAVSVPSKPILVCVPSQKGL